MPIDWEGTKAQAKAKRQKGRRGPRRIIPLIEEARLCLGIPRQRLTERRIRELIAEAKANLIEQRAELHRETLTQ